MIIWRKIIRNNERGGTFTFLKKQYFQLDFDGQLKLNSEKKNITF